MSRLKLTDFPIEVQNRIIRDNPHIYGVGKVEAKKPEPTAPQALVSRVQKPKRSAPGLEARVTLVAHRKRRADPDNNVASTKWLIDAIAESLGIDDGDQGIVFETHQIETKGEEGVMVKVEWSKKGQP